MPAAFIWMYDTVNEKWVPVSAENPLQVHDPNIQITKTTIDLKQAAGDYDLFIGTDEDVVLEKLLIRLPDVDCSDDADLTSISIQTDDTTPQVFISAASGAVVNLTARSTVKLDRSNNDKGRGEDTVDYCWWCCRCCYCL